MFKKKLIRNSKLLLVKITLDIIIRDTTKVNRIEDFVVNVDQALTSNLMFLNILRLFKTTKPFQLIILLIYLLLIKVLIKGDIVIALNLTTMLTITLTRIVTQNSIFIVIQINTLNFKSLFRIKFIIRIVIKDFTLVFKRKI